MRSPRLAHEGRREGKADRCFIETGQGNLAALGERPTSVSMSDASPLHRRSRRNPGADHRGIDDGVAAIGVLA